MRKLGLKLSLTVMLLLCIFASPMFGATYYIDYTATDDSANGTSKSTPWKRCPGMWNFAGTYTHSAGDIFVFKGGVTWPSIYSGGYWQDILTIQNSGGGVGTEDRYTVDKTWYVGGSWSYPVLDGGSPSGKIAGIGCAKSNIIIEYLRISNIGVPANGSGTGIYVGSGSNINIRYMYLDPNCVDAFDVGGSVDHIYFHDNTVRKAGRSSTFLDTGDSGSYLYYYNNVWEGSWDWVNPAGYHGDGFMIQYGSAVVPSDYPLKYVYVYNNKFWGDWSNGATAPIFLVGGWGVKSIQHAYIYNNLVTFSNNTNMSGGNWIGIALEAGLFDDINIENNTIDASAASVAPGNCILYGDYPSGQSRATNVTVKNNIIRGCTNGIVNAVAAGMDIIDNNIITPAAGNSYLINGSRGYGSSCSAIQTLGYGKTYCSVGDPLFVSNPTPASGGSGNYGVNNGNWRLQASSPAIGNGVNLSSYFTADLDGNARPSTGPWTIGAYIYGGTTLTPPQELRIISP